MRGSTVALGIAIAGALLIVGLELQEQFEAPKAVFLWVVALSFLTARLVSRGPAAVRPERFLDWAVVAWVLAALVSTLASVSLRTSILGDVYQRDGLLTTAALASLYLAGRDSRPRSWDRLAQLTLTLGGLVSLYALVQAAGLDPRSWDRAATYGVGGDHIRPFATFGHPNLLGAAVAALAAAGVARWMVHPGERAWLGPLLVLYAGTVVVTLSRAAWLATVCGCVTAAALAWSHGKVSWRLSALAWGSTVGAALIVALAVSQGGWGGLVSRRAGDVATVAAGGGHSRQEIWRGALEAWRARPWIGHGPGTFGSVFPRFQSPRYWELEWGGEPFHAHSIYLQTAATRGLAGLAAGGALMVGLVLGCHRAWGAGAPARRRVPAVAGMGVALAVAGLFGSIGVPGAMLLVLAALGAGGMDGSRDPERRESGEGASTGSSKRRRTRAARRGERGSIRDRAAWPVGLAMAGVAAVPVFRDFRGSHFAGIAHHLRTTSPLGAAAAARIGLRYTPADDRLARTLAEALLNAPVAPDSLDGVIRQAREAALRAVALEPTRGVNHLTLGRAYGARARLGDRASADSMEIAFERARALAPANANVLAEWAYLEYALGRPQRALAIARDLTALYPRDAVGHALVGQALAAQGDSVAARAAMRVAAGGIWRLESQRSWARRLTSGLSMPDSLIH